LFSLTPRFSAESCCAGGSKPFLTVFTPESISKTAEAVRSVVVARSTSLKRGVNEILKENRSGDKSTERALKTVSSTG